MRYIPALSLLVACSPTPGTLDGGGDAALTCPTPMVQGIALTDSTHGLDVREPVAMLTCNRGGGASWACQDAAQRAVVTLDWFAPMSTQRGWTYDHGRDFRVTSIALPQRVLSVLDLSGVATAAVVAERTVELTGGLRDGPTCAGLRGVVLAFAP